MKELRFEQSLLSGRLKANAGDVFIYDGNALLRLNIVGPHGPSVLALQQHANRLADEVFALKGENERLRDAGHD